VGLWQREEWMLELAARLGRIQYSTLKHESYFCIISLGQLFTSYMRLMVLLIILSSCNGLKPKKEKPVLEMGTMPFMEIKKNGDSIYYDVNSDRKSDFYHAWNSATNNTSGDAAPDFYIRVIPVNNMGLVLHDSAILFQTNENAISHVGGQDYLISDKSLVEQIWQRASGQVADFVEYIPLFYGGDKIYEYKPALTEKHKQNVKLVLGFYGESYKEINGTLYVDKLIEREMLWNYTTKAEDTVWLKEHIEK
jgi:hypothetical protein